MEPEHGRQPYSATELQSGLGGGLAQQLRSLPEPLHYSLLDYFCCLNFSQRRSFILEALKQMGIEYRILRTEDAFHIAVKPAYRLAAASPPSLFCAKCFVAHYDRRTQTPGANDNSAAIWHLLHLAVQMKRQRPLVATPMQIIFTDHEELRSKEGIRQQGAYLLGKHLLRAAPQLRYAFFVFDQCGIGDTLCYLPHVMTNRDILLQQDAIFQQVCRPRLRHLRLQRVAKNQYYFSDNLGLNLHRYPALLLSTLPREDLWRWQQHGQKPAAWRNSHTPGDHPSLLEAQSFALMNQALNQLCRI